MIRSLLIAAAVVLASSSLAEAARLTRPCGVRFPAVRAAAGEVAETAVQTARATRLVVRGVAETSLAAARLAVRELIVEPSERLRSIVVERAQEARDRRQCRRACRRCECPPVAATVEAYVEAAPPYSGTATAGSFGRTE